MVIKMKKITAIIMTASLLLLSGCGSDGNERVIEGNVQTIESANGQSGSSQQTDEAATGKQEDIQNDTAQVSDSTKGYAFIYNGVSVTMDADAAPIIEKLGEPASYFEAASCAFEGLDKMYTYSGFEIDTYPVGDKDYVSSVILKDDSVSTAEGICIGDSLEKLQQTYDGEGEENSGMRVYEKDGMKLCFIMQGQDIIAIEYRSTVLEMDGNGGQGN